MCASGFMWRTDSAIYIIMHQRRVPFLDALIFIMDIRNVPLLLVLFALGSPDNDYFKDARSYTDYLNRDTRFFMASSYLHT